jgi:exodeoxyribonuclease VII small subunit
VVAESKNPTRTTNPQEEAPYEVLVERLEAVVARLESADLPLEESVQAFKEGMDLLKRAEEKLRAAEKKVEELLDNGKTVPLSPERTPVEAQSGQPRRLAPAVDDDIPF